jgi:hypothetical protein
LPADDPQHRSQPFIHHHDQIAAATSHEITRAIVYAPNAAGGVESPTVAANGSL